jgi:hypothetical protein
LDNTLIDYTPSLPRVLKEFGLDPKMSREQIRGLYQKNDGSDDLWQEIQSSIYSAGLNDAIVSSGAIDCIKHLAANGHEIFIVSHKTRTTQERFGGVNLHSLAKAWISNSEIPYQFELGRNLFFCETLDEKISTIRRLGLSLFVDDLAKVLKHPDFPISTVGWHFVPKGADLTSHENSGDFIELLRQLEE